MTKRKAEKTMRALYRQGDVLIEAIDEAPAGSWEEIPREGGRVILAAGEATGHHHAIRDPGVCFLRADGVFERILDVMDPTALLKHEEHAEISLPKGKYSVVIQQTYTPAEIKNVQD